MNIILLIFFAIPLAVIIFSIALQKLLKCPALVAAIVIVIGIIVTFIIGSLIALAATLVYTLISYIVAVLTCFICRHFDDDNRNNCRRNCSSCMNRSNDNNLLTISSRCQNNGNGDLLTISSNCANGRSNDLLTINSNNNGNNCCCNHHDDGCGCGNGNDNQVNTINGVIRIVDNNCPNNTDEITTRINVVPNTANNGRSGCICGRYRRR